ncbi:MAG: hypothetical protein HY246_05285 [Proteobacteria bacterium]|nr:hypothetical protein [Pseudomonadota bacterium]
MTRLSELNGLSYAGVTLAVVVSGAASLAISGMAEAAPFTITNATIFPGLSKDHQLASGLSSLGAGVILDLSFTGDDANSTIGTFTAILTNTGNAGINGSGVGTVTALGLNIKDTLLPVDGKGNPLYSVGFADTPISCTFPDSKACDFSNGATGLSGFLSEVDLSAGANSPSPFYGLNAGESIKFEWKITAGNFAGLTAGSKFSDLVEPSLIDGPSVDFNAFWVAHVQQLGADQSASDKIGGALTAPGDPVSEPATMTLLACGLLGLGWAARRWHKKA